MSLFVGNGVGTMKRTFTISLLIAVCLCTSIPVLGQRLVSSQSRGQVVKNEKDRLAEQQRRRELSRNYSSARRFEQIGDYATSLGIYQKLMQNDSTNTRYLFGAGRSLEGLGRGEEAIVLLSGYLESYENKRDRQAVHTEMAVLYHRMGQEKEAQSQWELAIKSNSHSQSTYQNVASSMAHVRLLDKSIETLKRGRAVFNDERLFAHYMAMLYRAQMNWSDSAKEYLNLLRINRGQIGSVRSGFAAYPDDDAAHKAIEAAVHNQLESGSQEPWSGYHAALLEVLIDQKTKFGRFGEAFSEVITVDSLAGQHGKRVIEYAAMLLQEGELVLADSALSVASKLNDDSKNVGMIELARADVALHRGFPQQSDSLLSHLIEDTQDVLLVNRARQQRGILRQEWLGRNSEALEDFTRVIQHESGVAAQWRYRSAYCLARSGRFDEAEKTLVGLYERLDKAEHRKGPRPTEMDYQVVASADYLGAQIAFWRHDSKAAKEKFSELIVKPAGRLFENEALLRIKLLTTSEDSLHTETFASADSAAFTGDTTLAIALYDSLGSCAKGMLAVEAGWNKARLVMEVTGIDSALVAFTERYLAEPRSEEAWFLLGQYYAEINEMEKARYAFENVILGFEEGLLANVARLEVDKLEFVKYEKKN